MARGTKSDREVLDSWKEIAAFLRRGVRTVQRWERTEGLPVRRHGHLKRGSVYAVRSEVELWVRARKFGAGARVGGQGVRAYDLLRGHIQQLKLVMGEVRAQRDVMNHLRQKSERLLAEHPWPPAQ